MNRKLRKLLSGGNRAQNGSKNRGSRRSAVQRAVRACIEQIEPRIMLSAYTVTGTADGAGTITGSGPFMATTLRAAINAANTDGGSNTITLPAGTYAVNNTGLGELLISSDIDLEGAGSSTTIIDATGLGARVFEVSANSGTVTLNGLTVEHGTATDEGGGILLSGTGTLNLTNDLITDNALNGAASASAVYGGGISVDAAGTLNLLNTTVSDNTATIAAGGSGDQPVVGGGIATRLGTVSIRSSTVSGNVITGNSEDPNDFVGSPGLGGGIANVSGILNVSDSTVAGNTANGGMGGNEGFGGTAGGGGIYSDSTTTVRSTTIAFNFAHAGIGMFGSGPATAAGGGFDDVATSHPTIADTIIAKNQTQNGIGAAGPNDVATTGSFNSLGGNLIGVGIASNFTASKDQNGTSGTPLDPLFTSTSVQNNGGPTQTLLPGAASPAIDAGLNAQALDTDGTTPLTSDQRGNARIANGTVDIGAVETPAMTDLSVTKVGPATATAGAPVTYTVTVTNNGSSDAQTVSLSDAVPTGETFVSVTVPSGWTRTDSTAVGGTGTLTFTDPTLASGASGTFTIVDQLPSSAASGAMLSNTATVSTATIDTNSANNSATATSTVVTAADISVVKTGPATAVAGADITYTITIHNAGPSDNPSEGLIDSTTGDISNTDLTQVSGPDPLSTLPAGGTSVFSYTLHVNSDAADGSQVVNTFSATGVATDPNLSNNSSTVTTTISTDADVSIVKTGPVSASPGHAFTYTITLTNNGPSDAQDVVMSDALPAGTDPSFSLHMASGPDSFLADDVAGTLTETAQGPIVPGSVDVFTLVVTPSTTDADGSTILNTANVSSTTPDSVTSNNSSTATTTVANAADVSVTKTGPATVLPGGPITYTISITNNGPNDAQGVVLSDMVPAGTGDSGFDLNKLSGPDTFLADDVGGTLTETAQNPIASGSTDTFILAVGANTGDMAGSTITNTASVSTTSADANSTNNSATVTTTVNGLAVVAVAGPDISSVEGQSTGSVVLATFTDPGGAETDPTIYDHYTADIDWGDGKTDTIDSASNPDGAITFDSSTQTFTLTGTHTYAEEDFLGFVPYDVTVTIHHDSAPDASVTDIANVSDPAVIATGGLSFSGSEGSDTGPLTLATFTDPGGAENITDYSASVDWGDGTPVDTSATIVDEGGGVFGVVDSHTYAEESSPGRPSSNPYNITVTVNHDVAPDSNIVTDTAHIADPSVVAAPVPVTGVEGKATGSVAVATFTDPGGPEILGSYAPSINWGDGTAATTGTLSYNASTQTFTVMGNHTYKEESDPDNPSHDPYIVTVTIHHQVSIPTTITTTAFISDPAVVGTGVSAISAKKGIGTGTITLANFTDPGGTEAASDYSATINWGDGSSPTNGTIVLSGGKLSVTGSHTYNSTGTFHPTIVIHHETAPDSNTVTDTVNVASSTTLTATGVNSTGTEGRSFTAKVASFVTSNNAAVIGNFTATINWGDGTTSSGTIVKDSNGHFHVNGTHTYHEESTGSGYTVTTTIKDNTGNTVTAGSLATIADAPLDTPAGLSLSKSVNVAFTNLVLGSFRDQDATNTMGSDYTGTITWGDGTTSAAGFVFKSATTNVGSFWSVTGSHKYTTKKTYAVKIVLHDNASPTKTITINTTIKVS